MTASDPPTEEAKGAPSGGTTESIRPPTHSRRRLLKTMTVGGALALSGCGQDASGTRTGSPGSAATTFRFPVSENAPNKTSFFPLAPESTFATVVKEKPKGKLDGFLWENGQWFDGLWVGADVQYSWADGMTITPTEVTVSIGDNARWSDGHQITGRDIAVPVLDSTIDRFFRPTYASDEKDEPSFVLGAFDDFEITEQSVTYRSSQAYFDQFWDWAIRTWLGAFDHVPTHIEPYDAYAEGVVETVHRAQTGDIHPWGDRRRPGRGGTGPTKQALRQKHLDDRKYVEKFADPANVLASGAWDLVELRGSEAFVFEPNPHHRNADRINYESVVLEYTQSDQRKHAALKADQLDYGSGVTPQTMVESFPSHITEFRIPGGWGTGNELGLNFNHPALGNRYVRLAIMYALDQPTIAGNIHQSTAKPVATPGGDCWDATDYVSQGWIDETLTTYSTNGEKAASLMRKAGYTNDGGQWQGPNGDAITLTLATTRDTPRWEPTVASQLSEFGIKTSVQSLSDSVFQDRVEAGEFPLWARSGGSTSTAAATLAFWLAPPKYRQQYGIYPEEQFETGRFSTEGDPLPRTEDRWRIFTIDAPPIGQPDSPLDDYHPSALALAFHTNPPAAEFRRRVKNAMWLANWFLPTIPINKTFEQHFIDDTHWVWPTDTPSWQTFTAGGQRLVESILAGGKIRANPNDPEERAAVAEY